jgi:hypothetical protein
MTKSAPFLDLFRDFEVVGAHDLFNANAVFTGDLPEAVARLDRVEFFL